MTTSVRRRLLPHVTALALLSGCFDEKSSPLEKARDEEVDSTDSTPTSAAEVPSDAAAPASDEPDRSPGPSVEELQTCHACATGTLDGVELCIWADDCNFEVGEGGTFYYSVQVDRSAAITTSERLSGCGSPSSDPLSFVDYWVTDDQGTQYCVCDLGLCAPQDGESITLQTGEFSSSLDWPGREWNGPSDVAGAPLGPFFGPGQYVARIAFGTRFALSEGTVSVDLPIQVLPLDVALTEPCVDIEGQQRECGWDMAEEAYACEPGVSVALGCGAGCALKENTCSGAPMVRVCPSDNPACAADAALATVSGTCSVGCPVAEFVCPGSGSVAILTGATLGGDPYECAPVERLDPEVVGTPPASMPERYSQFAAALGPDGRIYVSGGAGYLSDCAVYDPETNDWASIARLTQPRGGHGAATGADGRIYVFGGRGDDSEESILAHAEAYDPLSDTWTPVTPMPTARLAPAVVAANDGKIYVIGGSDYSAETGFLANKDVVEAYDPSTDTWATVASAPHPGFWMQAVLANDGRIYAFTMGPQGQVSIYDPSTDTWSLGAANAVARWGAGAALAADGGIIVAGGPPTDHRTIAERYDPATDTWQRLAPMAYAREYCELVSDQHGTVYAMGGESSLHVERYLLDERVWY